MAFDPQVSLPQVRSGKEKSSGENDRSGLKQMCQDFESIFVNSLFQQMRKTVPDEGFLSGGSDLELYQEMMDMEVAREMARKGGLGLGRMLYEQLGNCQKVDK